MIDTISPPVKNFVVQVIRVTGSAVLGATDRDPIGMAVDRMDRATFLDVLLAALRNRCVERIYSPGFTDALEGLTGSALSAEVFNTVTQVLDDVAIAAGVPAEAL